MSPARKFANIALVVAAVLIVLSGLNRRSGDLQQLVSLLLVVAVVSFVGRGALRWWKGQPPGIASVGLTGALIMAGVGWLVVGVFHVLLKIFGDNFGMIIVAPLMMLMGLAVGCGALVAVATSAGAVFTALTKSPPHRSLIVTGAAVAVALNVAYVWVLARMLMFG